MYMYFTTIANRIVNRYMYFTPLQLKDMYMHVHSEVFNRAATTYSACSGWRTGSS